MRLRKSAPDFSEPKARSTRAAIALISLVDLKRSAAANLLIWDIAKMTLSNEMPANLGPRGLALWSAVTDEYELAAHEGILLEEAARTVDLIDALIAERAPVAELRAQRLTLLRIMATLRLPLGEEDGSTSRPQRRGGARGAYGYREGQ